MLTLEQALDTADTLAERLAAVRDPQQRADLEQKQAMVDFTAFGLFKEADIGQALGQLGKPLAWGLGLGLPALGVGHALISDARHQGNDMVANARNQALLTALGVGGMQAAGNAAKNIFSFSPRQREETHETLGPDNQHVALNRNTIKLSGDRAGLTKLAAFVLLDNVLEAQLARVADHEKRAVAECLFINRSQGTALLRKLR